MCFIHILYPYLAQLDWDFCIIILSLFGILRLISCFCAFHVKLIKVEHKPSIHCAYAAHITLEANWRKASKS